MKHDTVDKKELHAKARLRNVSIQSIDLFIHK